MTLLSFPHHPHNYQDSKKMLNLSLNSKTDFISASEKEIGID